MLRARGLPRDRRIVRFSVADVQLADTLEFLDDTVSYTSWIFDLVEPYLGPTVLEVGAGHGTFTERLARDDRTVVATDLSERCVKVLEDRFADVPAVEIVSGSVDAVAGRGPFATAVLINVLEHIEDDEEALRHLVELLEPGGRLVLWVPAFELLYSDFDRRIGHHRRYRLPGLRDRISRAGLEVLDIRYINPVGAIGWFVIARLLGRDPVGGVPAKLFHRFLLPVLRAVERRVRPPFGQSIFVAAIRPSG